MKPVCRTALLCAAFATLGFAFEAAAAPAPDAPAKATSASSQRITQILKRLGQARDFHGVSISPNGKRLAWTVSTKAGNRVQVADVDGSHVETVQLAGAFKGCSEDRPSWSPDGAQIAFLSNCGNPKDKAQSDIYLVDTGSATPTAHRLTHLDGYVHDLAWAPNGKHLGILYVHGDTHRIGATAASKPRVGVIGVSGVEHQQMAEVNAGNGAVHEVTPKSLFVYDFSFSPKSSRIAYVAAPPPGADNWWTAKLYTQAVAQAQPHELVNAWAATGSLHHLQMALPRWSPDGSTIAFIGGLMSDQGATGGDIYLVPAKGGKVVDVTPGIHLTPSWLTWTGNQHLLVSSVAGAMSQLGLFTLHGTKAATHRKLDTLPAAFGDGGAVSAIALASNHDHYAFVHSTFDQAPEIFTGTFRLDAAGQPVGMATKAHAVTQVNAAIQPMWGKAVPVNWHDEGFDVAGWLLFPAHYDPNKSYPMITYVHGGPVWAVRPRWPRAGYGPAPLSALGYFVFMPNPRGSMGQGEAYTKAIRRQMGYVDLRDILAGINVVEAKYPIDDNRLGLTGWSYGGFMSMFVPTQTDRFSAVVAGAGLSDWKSYYGENMIDKWMLPFFGASVYQDPAAYAKSSAINFVKNAKAPTLMVVGQFDKECPAPQSFEWWHALRAMGVPTKLVVYPGEGHAFHKPADRRNVLERALAWFQKYLAPANTEPVSG